MNKSPFDRDARGTKSVCLFYRACSTITVLKKRLCAHSGGKKCRVFHSFSVFTYYYDPPPPGKNIDVIHTTMRTQSSHLHLDMLTLPLPLLVYCKQLKIDQKTYSRRLTYDRYTTDKYIKRCTVLCS